MSSPRHGMRTARLALLAATLVFAVALVIGAWVSYRGTRAAVAALNSGQAELVQRAMRRAFEPSSRSIDSTELSRFMSDDPQLAVRYIGVLDRSGRVAVSAGTPAAPPSPPPWLGGPPRGPSPAAVGDRIRVYLRGPQAPGRDRGVDGAPAAGAPAGRQARGDFALVEFEPVASGLVARATGSLVLACVGAGLLVLASLLFWRVSERYAEARVRLEEQRRLSSLGEMSAVLAHEIRNPLASLKGAAQLLAEKLPESSRERERADRVVHEAVRIEALTSDLLGFARSGPVELRPAEPAELMRRSIADVSEGGFELDAATAPAEWPLDAARVRQALVNVLDNARHASPDGRPPHVRVFGDRGRLVYEVRDFGPGIPPGSEQRIFDPFFTTRTSGTGLGLAVSRRVVELHGGVLIARNHPDGGAVFRIELPSTAG